MLLSASFLHLSTLLIGCTSSVQLGVELLDLFREPNRAGLLKYYKPRIIQRLIRIIVDNKRRKE